MDIQSNHTSPQRQHLHPQAKEIVYNVLKYFNLEKQNNGPVTDVAKAITRVSEATKISEITICRISKCGKETEHQSESPVFQVKRKRKTNPVTNFDNFNKSVLRRTILNYYERKEIPTLDKVILEMKENIGYNGCKESLRKVIHNIGFRFAKVNGRKFLMERDDVLSLRTHFLRQMNDVKKKKLPIIYLDETWVNQNYTVGKCWINVDSTKATGVKHPTGKGGRIIVLHAGSKDGFVPNAKLTFLAKNDGDYHHQMNHMVFEKWFRTQLIPNIPPSSVIVMDNAPYHSVKMDSPPTSATRKDEIREWLIRNGVNPPDNCYKRELLHMVKSRSHAIAIKYVIDKIANDHGHRVIRLPPYYCHYNPIELI